MKLKDEELKKINGGSGAAVLGIAGGILLIIGILDGIVRPFSCKGDTYESN